MPSQRSAASDGMNIYSPPVIRLKLVIPLSRFRAGSGDGKAGIRGIPPSPGLQMMFQELQVVAFDNGKGFNDFQKALESRVRQVFN